MITAIVPTLKRDHFSGFLSSSKIAATNIAMAAQARAVAISSLPGPGFSTDFFAFTAKSAQTTTPR